MTYATPEEAKAAFKQVCVNDITGLLCVGPRFRLRVCIRLRHLTLVWYHQRSIAFGCSSSPLTRALS